MPNGTYLFVQHLSGPLRCDDCLNQPGDGELSGGDVDWQAEFAQGCRSDRANRSHPDSCE